MVIEPHDCVPGGVSTSTFDVPGRATLACAALAALGCLLLALLGAAPAAAATWRAPAGLSVAGPHPTFGAQVAVDPMGNAIAVWQRSNGANDVVQAAVRPAGGDWQAPADLSIPLENASAPQVAVDAQGNAIAVWQGSPDGSDPIVQGAVRPLGGGWQAPVDISGLESASAPQVAVDPQGNAVVVWDAHDPAANTRIVQSSVRLVGENWQLPVDLSDPLESADGSRVAVDAHGNAVAVWQSFNDTSTRVQSAVRPAGGGWQQLGDISAAGASAAQVAVDAQGNAVAVWQRGGLMNSVVQGAVRPAGGSWQPAIDLSGAGASAAQVAVDPQGNAVAVWQRGIGAGSVVQGAVRPAGGGWQPAGDLSGAGASAAQVAVDPQGNAVAVWQRGSGTSAIVQSAARPAGGGWQALVDLSAGGARAAQVAVDPRGNAFAVWVRFDGNDYAAQAAVRLADAVVAPPAAGPGSGADGPQAAAEPQIPSARPPAAPPVATVATLRLSSSRLRAVRSGPSARKATSRSGTRVSYALNIAATVRFTVERATRGRSVGGRCVKPSKSNRSRKSCTRYAAVRGSFTRIRPAGADRFTFTGRMADRALRPGRYRLLATPTAGGRTGAPATVRFSMVR